MSLEMKLILVWLVFIVVGYILYKALSGRRDEDKTTKNESWHRYHD